MPDGWFSPFEFDRKEESKTINLHTLPCQPFTSAMVSLIDGRQSRKILFASDLLMKKEINRVSKAPAMDSNEYMPLFPTQMICIMGRDVPESS